MWRIVYFVISFLIALMDYYFTKTFNYKTVSIFLLSAVLIFLFEFLLIRKKSSKITLAFFISFFLTILTVLLTISTVNMIGIKLSTNEKLIILFIEGYLTFGIIAAFIPNISNMLNLTKPDKNKTAKILDTSVIVDGRIYDIAEKKFFDGLLVLPEFVIKEIQFLSDARDPQKRIRGRRALEILNKMKSSKNILLSITDIDFPNIKEVDLKLIELAKKMDAKVITNDFNLMKVASIHEVEILNINDLANSLHVVVLPGETIKIDLIREGKDKQALGYLEDGTMIVVDNAKHLIGKNVEIEIDNVLPKEAGRVIFASLVGAKQSNNNKKRHDK
ncbi:TRAM domain-containing protein [Brachyspira murdochii]|uniref:PilT protein domain protein n=2 Tax=Brachyspira murdochii TaxID=84378 RepID=D5UA79_BRAM5|nr:PIN domain-containing protein [Brachyspira murdochii]ADG71602.1 PilT protein domain protein [Brachyspira murdochii DSM 12563]PPS22498.1 membrane protein [Brachyspira murdochii]